MNIVKNLLPENCYRKKRYAEIESITLHYISAIKIDRNDPYNVDKCIKILKDYEFSAHYLVARNGQIIQLVLEENCAWHAGVSSLQGKSVKNSCNDFTIGIELIGGKWEKFTADQYKVTIELVKDILSRYPITKENIVSHQYIAPTRKVDIGKHFDWNRLWAGVYTKGIIGNLEQVMTVKEIDENEKLIRTSEHEITSGVVPVENNIEVFHNNQFKSIQEVPPPPILEPPPIEVFKESEAPEILLISERIKKLGLDSDYKKSPPEPKLSFFSQLIEQLKKLFN